LPPAKNTFATEGSAQESMHIWSLWKVWQTKHPFGAKGGASKRMRIYGLWEM